MEETKGAAEAMFFNAANIALDSNSGKLQSLRDKFPSWEKVWQSLETKFKTIEPEKEWQRLETNGVRLLLRENKNYPALLREISNPPIGLYIRGALPEQEKLSLAIVGTRKATTEGRALAKRFAAELSARGFVIISGLALGIDASAHEGCLESGSQTIAVLGNGLGRFYPRTNERLAKKIIGSGGALVSEYPLEAEPFPYRFLERNRIISGLSRGVLIVEAPETSGALATARYAAEQNREVFVMPGHVSHPNYRGSNQLIRQGAELVTNPEEILEAFGVETAEQKAKTYEFDSATERTIFEVLSKSANPLSVSTLAEKTNLDISEINRALTFMTIKGTVEETGAGYTIGK